MRTEKLRKDQKHPLCYDPMCKLHATPKTNAALRTMFPRASKSFLDANSAPLSQVHTKDAIAVNVAPKRGTMNKTEAEFAMILEAQKRRGEILRYEFEGITLRFANVKYTPDFVVFPAIPPDDVWGKTDTMPKFIEVKGPFCKGKFERAVERFRHAKTYWPEFTFELHQRTKDGWRQII